MTTDRDGGSVRRHTAARTWASLPLVPLAVALGVGIAVTPWLSSGVAWALWLGGVTDDFVVPLGVDRFGQSGDIPDLYRVYGLDREAIIDAAARACLRAMPASAAAGNVVR